MEAATTTPPATGKRRDAGPKAPSSTIKWKPLKDNLRDLVELKNKSDAAKETLAEKVKAIAKQAGIHAAVVRRLVAAKASDKFDTHKALAEQMAIVFDEFDSGQQEISGGAA